MVKPVVKKVMMGVPAVALSAALACTMAGCGGTESGQGGSGDGTAATQAAYQSQSIDVEGFTVESLADGTYYRGDVYKADGFWLRVKITNNNDKAMKRFSFITTGAPGGYEAGDPVFDSHDTLSYDIKNPPAELCEGAETDGDPEIQPGESIEWVYFWTTKDNYYGPITVQFDKNATGGTDPRTMRFDTTGKETDGYKAAVDAAEAIKAQGGVDYAAYSVKAADGWSLVETKEKSSDATFNPEGSTKRFSTSTCSRAPQKEAEALQGNFGGKGEIDEVDINGATWTRYTQTGTYYMFTVAPCGTTVRMFIDSGITWEDAMPMMQNVTLK